MWKVQEENPGQDDKVSQVSFSIIIWINNYASLLSYCSPIKTPQLQSKNLGHKQLT